MREVISLSTGQAGIQIGKTCWELYCLEHGLDESGFLIKKPENEEPSSENPETQSPQSNMEQSIHTSRSRLNQDLIDCTLDGFDSFFMEMSNGNYSPRNLMIDLEPTVVDVIRTGVYRNLYHPMSLISAKEDAANNFARGYYSTGDAFSEEVLDSVRSMTEKCDRLQGFMTYHSIGGGTGSGFHTLLSMKLSELFPKMSKLEISICPSPTLSTAVVEPYNAVLTTHHTMNYSECIFLADNEAMYKICQKKLRIDSPTYATLNKLLAQTVSSITASLRFKGTLNADFSDFQTNLVPYPRIHFPIISYAPIMSGGMVSHESVSVFDITSTCFETSNRLVHCDTPDCRYIACCLLYRGDITPKDINTAISVIKQKKRIRFVEWSPTGFKVGINERAPVVDCDGDMASSTKACCMLSNTTVIKELWTSLNIKFHSMLDKRAFLHWYMAEGMELEEFYKAQDDLLQLEQDYACINNE